MSEQVSAEKQLAPPLPLGSRVKYGRRLWRISAVLTTAGQRGYMMTPVFKWRGTAEVAFLPASVVENLQKC